MPQELIKKYRPDSFVPSTSFTGEEAPLLFRGENMWLRYGRFGGIYAEGYNGTQDLSQSVSSGALTGQISWTSGSKVVTGSGTAFLSELHLGSFIFADKSGATELFVVEKITSDTSFTSSRVPTASSGGNYDAYICPVAFPLGTDIGTALRGVVQQYYRGHYIGVGRGTLAVNGSTTLGSGGSLVLSRTPQFALYDAATDTYTQDDVGIDSPLVPPTLAAAAAGTTSISSSTNASPIVVTTGSAHGLYTGQEVEISNHLINTAANGRWFITALTSTTFSLDGSTGNGVGGATGTISGSPEGMVAGNYNIRIVNRNTTTNGYSQPSPVSAPVTLTTGQFIQITFNTAMLDDQDAYDIYGTRFLDESTATTEARYNGPWYKVATITATNLQTTATPTGRESGTSIRIAYRDLEIANATQILTFNNFLPREAEFLDIINGFPIYFSCQGKDRANSTTSRAPGPAAIPAKPSNPEAVFLDKTITTAGADVIVGEFNAKSRIYALCQNSLQTLILTTLDEEPITFRSLWNSGFRNPYNVAFVKEYLYGFSTQKIVRSVAGGDDSAMEFEFTSDVRDYIEDWPCGHILVSYDPKNRAVLFIYSAAEKRNGYWVSIALPFLLDKQVWNPPIILQKANTDFIVSGVATVNENLILVAGGRTSGGSVSFGTYIFDGGDSDTKSWYLAWAYSDDGFSVNAKTIKGASLIGRFASSNTKVQLYGMRPSGVLQFGDLEAGTNDLGAYTFGATAGIGRVRARAMDLGPFSLYTTRVSGSYTTTVDRLDALILGAEVANSPQ